MNWKVCIIIFMLLSVNSIASSKKDGIYFSFEKYKNNQPWLIFDKESLTVIEEKSGFEMMLFVSQLNKLIKHTPLLKGR